MRIDSKLDSALLVPSIRLRDDDNDVLLEQEEDTFSSHSEELDYVDPELDKLAKEIRPLEALWDQLLEELLYKLEDVCLAKLTHRQSGHHQTINEVTIALIGLKMETTANM